MADAKKDAKSHEEFTVPAIKGAWDKAVYTDSSHIDNLMSAMLQMGTEFWTLKRRQMVVERLLEDKKHVTEAAIDAYQPSEKELAKWDTARDDFIQRVFTVFTREVDKPRGA